MSDTYRIWCFVKGDNNAFFIAPSSTILMAELKLMIKGQKSESHLLQGVDATTLILWKVRYF